MLTIPAAEREFGISRWVLRDLVADGHIAVVCPPAQPGHRRRPLLDRMELERAIAQWTKRGEAALVQAGMDGDDRERDDRGRYVKIA